MMFDIKKVQDTVTEIDRIVKDGLSGDDISHLLNLVSRLQWQVGNLTSDIAEEVLGRTQLKGT
jgi:hypothetical protein